MITAVKNKILKEMTSHKKFSPLKIAILDTGYDGNAPSFCNPGLSQRMRGWRDFVSGSPTPVDSDGHGTHLTTLLLQMALSAEIYVARVAENSRGLASAEGNISQVSSNRQTFTVTLKLIYSTGYTYSCNAMGC